MPSVGASVGVATTAGAAAATAVRGVGTVSVEGTKTGGFGAPPSEKSVSTRREHRSCFTYRGLFEGIFAPQTVRRPSAQLRSEAHEIQGQRGTLQ